MDGPAAPEPLHTNLLEALFYIDFEAQQRWVASLDDAAKLNLLAVSRRVRARLEPHLRRARLSATLESSAPSDWLRSLDNFFAAVARRRRCDQVIMTLGLPAKPDATSKLALAFESAADSGCLPQVTCLQLSIHVVDDEGARSPAVPSWGRKHSPKAAVGLAAALGTLFPKLRELTLSGSWVLKRLLEEEGVKDMYGAWATTAGTQSGRPGGALAGLQTLELPLQLHMAQAGGLPQLRRLVLLEPRDDYTMNLQPPYRAVYRMVTPQAHMVGLEEVAFRSPNYGMQVAVVPFPPDLQSVLMGTAAPPPAGAQDGAAGPALAPEPAPPQPWLRRLAVHGYTSSLPLEENIGPMLEDAEDKGARSFTLRSLVFDRSTFTYSLSSPRLTVLHLREWLRLCTRPMGPPGEQRRLAVDIFTNNLTAPCGPLGASTAVSAWAEIAAVPAAERARHVIVVSAEAHAAGLLAAIRMVSVMAIGFLQVRGMLVVHWDGWRQEWSPSDSDDEEQGRDGQGTGSGGLPSLTPTPERAEELADKLKGLPAELRPRTLRVCLSRRSHGGEVLPAAVEELRQAVEGACTVKITWI